MPSAPNHISRYTAPRLGSNVRAAGLEPSRHRGLSGLIQSSEAVAECLGNGSCEIANDQGMSGVISLFILDHLQIERFPFTVAEPLNVANPREHNEGTRYCVGSPKHFLRLTLTGQVYRQSILTAPQFEISRGYSIWWFLPWAAGWYPTVNNLVLRYVSVGHPDTP